MPDAAAKVVLDTHVWLWVVLGSETLSRGAQNAILKAAREGRLILPAIALWEVAMLAERGRITPAMPLTLWMDEALRRSGIALAALSPAIAIDSVRLPGTFHRDPADRLIVATARALGGLLVTRDDRILRYGRTGHVGVLAA